MRYICSGTRHLVSEYRDESPPPFCARHGAKLFVNCRVCRKPRRLISENSYSSTPDSGARFCVFCSTPAPWLERGELMEWVRNQVKASGDLTDAARGELVAVLDRIKDKDMDPRDDKAVPGWMRLNNLSPKLFAAIKPVRDALMSEGVERALDALLG
jgi:hypothetical protein